MVMTYPWWGGVLGGSCREDNGQLIGNGNDKIESGIVWASVKHEKSHIVCIIQFFPYFEFEGINSKLQFRPLKQETIWTFPPFFYY